MTWTLYRADAKVDGRPTTIANCKSEDEARAAMAVFTAAGYTVTDVAVASYQVAAKTYRLP